VHIKLHSTMSYSKHSGNSSWVEDVNVSVTASIEASNSGNIHYSTDNNLTTLYISKCHISFVCVIFHMSSNGELLQPILLAVCWIYRNCREWRRYKIEQKVRQKVGGNLFRRVALPGCSHQSYPIGPLEMGGKEQNFVLEIFFHTV